MTVQTRFLYQMWSNKCQRLTESVGIGKNDSLTLEFHSTSLLNCTDNQLDIAGISQKGQIIIQIHYDKERNFMEQYSSHH